ncbi:MAG: DUF6220 domain-containing protein [Candidatus Dormiibacterota bacterium]
MTVDQTLNVRPVVIPTIRARIFSALSVLLAALVVLQIFVASTGLFTIAHQLDNGHSYGVAAWNDSSYWGIHFMNAFAITIVILLMVGAGFLARVSGRLKKLTGLLFGLLVLQAALGFVPWPAPLAALHVLNAFVMLAVTLYVVREGWAFGRSAR